MSWLRLPLVVALAALVLGCATSAETRQQAKRDQEAAQFNVQLGISYMRQNRLEQADEKLAKALEQDPELPAAHNAYAVLRERLGEFDMAERHYRRAIELDPKDSEARSNFGAFLCRLGRPEEAQRQFEAAWSNPLYSRPEAVFTTAGICAVGTGDTERGEEYLRRALDRNPDYLPALYEMAGLTFREERYLQTRAYVQRYDAALAEAARRNPQLPKANAQMLWLCVQAEQQLGNVSTAQSCAQKLKNQFPESRQTTQLLELERRGR
jgi:type IV pilus assembly protein PilF